MADVLNVEISKNLVEPIVQAKIQAAVVSALESPQLLIEELVRKCLNMKVDRDGKVQDYASHNKHSWIDILCRQSIQKAVEEAMKEWVAENQKLLKDQVKRQISTSPAKFAKMFCDGLADSLNCSWKFSVHVGDKG